MRKRKSRKPDFELLVGRKPVLDAMEDRLSIEKVYIDRDLKGTIEKQVRKACKAAAIPLKVVPKVTLDKITRANHQGLLAEIAHITYHDIHDIIYQAFTDGRMPFIGILDGVTDVRNFGAIARSAEFFGVDGLLIGSSRSAAINDLAMKTSTGALARLPVARVPSLVNVMPELKAAGLALYSADIAGEKNIRELEWKRPVAIVLGSEGLGVTREINDQVDEQFLITKAGTMESLNIRVAAGICFYEGMMGRMK